MSDEKMSKTRKFIDEAERIRKAPISQEDIDRLNELGRLAEIEERENEENFEIPAAAKSSNEADAAQI